MSKKKANQSGQTKKVVRPKVLPWTSRRESPGVVMRTPRLNRKKRGA